MISLRTETKSLRNVKLLTRKSCATFVTHSDLVCQDCALVVPGKGSASAASD